MVSNESGSATVIGVDTADDILQKALAETAGVELGNPTATSIAEAREALAETPADGVVYDDRGATTSVGSAVTDLLGIKPWLPVLILVGDAAAGAAALDAGATDVFVVPESPAAGRLLAGRLETVLEADRHFTDRLVDALDDVFYLVGPDGDLRRWNDRLNEVTGYTDDEIASMAPLDFFEGADRDLIAEAIAGARETGSVTVEADLVTKAGEAIPYEYTGTRITDDEGTVQGIVGIGRDVTELTERNRMLERERDRLAAVFDATPYPFVHATFEDGKPIVEQINDAFAAVFGYDAADLAGEPLDEYIVPEHDRDVSREIVDRLLAGESLERELVRETATGEERHFRFRSTPLTRADGTTEAVAAFVDVTEEKDRIQKLDQLRQHVSDVIWMSSVRKETMDFISDSYEDVWGRSTESLRAEPMSFVEAVHPDDRERVEAALADQQSAPDEYDETYRVVQPDGEVRWVRDRAAGVYEDGELTRIVGVATDITARKERERELAVKDRAMDEAPVGITIHDGADPRTGVRYVNEGFTAVTGYDTAALDGDGLSLLAGEETDPDRLATLERAVETGAAASADLLCYRADGRPFWARISVAPVTDDRGAVTHVVGSIEDVTESKKHEQEIERRLDEFGEILAEDLRTPLREAQAALDDVADTADVDLTTVDRSLQRVDQLIDDLTAVHTHAVKSRTLTESLVEDGGSE